MIVSFVCDLLLQMQTIRHQNQIEKFSDYEILEFSETTWNNFPNKDEIKFNGKYYDVALIEKRGSTIFAKVVCDDLENELHVFIAKINKDSKVPLSNKIKSFSKHLINQNDFLFTNDFLISSNKLQKFSFISNDIISGFNTFLERPPC